MADTKQLTIKMAIQASDYRKQLKNINTQNKLLKSEFNSLSEASDDFENSLEGQSAKLKLLSGQLDGAKKKFSIYSDEIEKCENTLDQATKAYEKQREEVASLTLQVDEYAAAFGESSEVVQKMRKSLEEATKELAKKEMLL